MISPASEVEGRLHRFHPNDVQSQPSTASSSVIFYSPDSSPRSSVTSAVKSCKHCNFTFRLTDSMDQENDDYCSKDCRVCHTWFKSTSHSPRSTKVAIVSTSSSPTVKSPKVLSSLNKESNNTIVNHHSNNEKMREYFTQIRTASAPQSASHSRCPSPINDLSKSNSGNPTSNATWRECKEVMFGGNVHRYIDSENSGDIHVFVSPLPHFQRVLNYFC